MDDSVDDQDAKNFYQEITKIKKYPTEDPTEDEVKKLKEFISSNKDTLTYIFKQEDGLTRLAKVMPSIGDDCVANIANNLNNMVISFLLDDKNKETDDKNKETDDKNKETDDKIKETVEKYSYQKLIYNSLIASGILQKALEGGASNASVIEVIKDYNKDDTNNPLNNMFISSSLLEDYRFNNPSKPACKDLATPEIKPNNKIKPLLFRLISRIIGCNINL